MDAYGELLSEIQREWNRAEADIKLAEQICKDVDIPSINELRYAGRRLIDALAKIATAADQKDIEDLLRDARFFCHRARHDAIDTASAQIAVELDIRVEELGYEIIVATYPNYAPFLVRFQSIKKRIVEAREKREDREALYAQIEDIDFKPLADEYEQIKNCEPIMQKVALRRRRRESITYIALAVESAVIVLGLIHLFIL